MKFIFLFLCSQQPELNKFEAKLRKQKFESENDSKWLQQEETKRQSFVATLSSDSFPNEALPYSEQNMTNDAEVTSIVQKQKDLTKTLPIDRTNDNVYTATTSVVKAIMSLSHGVEKAAAADYLNLVRFVGIELRTLLSSVDSLASIFPPQALKYNPLTFYSTVLQVKIYFY